MHPELVATCVYIYKWCADKYTAEQAEATHRRNFALMLTACGTKELLGGAQLTEVVMRLLRPPLWRYPTLLRAALVESRVTLTTNRDADDNRRRKSPLGGRCHGNVERRLPAWPHHPATSSTHSTCASGVKPAPSRVHIYGTEM